MQIFTRCKFSQLILAILVILSILVLIQVWNDFYSKYVMKLAKIIKMDFSHGNLMHSALVSISGDYQESFIHVQLLQSFFKKVFGVEHIRFKNLNGQLELEEVSYPFMRQIASIVNV